MGEVIRSVHPHDAYFDDRRYIGWSGFVPSRLPHDCGIPGDALQGSTLSHTIDTASRHDAERAGGDFRTTTDQARRELLSVGTFLGRLLS